MSEVLQQDEILRQESSRDKAPSEATRLCLLGAPGAGKTCFLGGLSLLADPRMDSPLRVYPEDAAAKRIFSELRDVLRSGEEWPAKTAFTESMTVSVQYGGLVIDLRVMEHGGERMVEELVTGAGGTATQDLREHVLRSEAAILMLDPDDHLAEADSHLMGVQALHEIRRQGGEDRPLDVAVVLSKADRHPELTDNNASAAAFLKQTAPELVDRLKERAGEVKVFAVSAVGRPTEAGQPPPLDPRPTGYEELFQWLLQKRFWRQKKAKWGPWAVGACVILLALAVSYAGWGVVEQSQTEADLDEVINPDSTIREVAAVFRSTNSEQARSRARERLEVDLDGRAEMLADARGEDAVNDILEGLSAFVGPGLGELADRVEQLKIDARAKLEQLAFEQVRQLYGPPTGQAFEQAAREFLADSSFASGSHADTVTNWLQEYRDAAFERKRRQIGAMSAGTPERLAAKAKAIDEHLDEFPDRYTDDAERRLRRAAELARMFSRSHRYNVTLKRSGGFATAREHSLYLLHEGKTRQKFTPPGAVRSVTWNATFPLDWQAGQRLTWTILEYEYWNEQVAWFSDKGPLALRLMHGKQKPTTWADGWREDSPELFIECEVEGISEEDWDIVHRYIYPGESW